MQQFNLQQILQFVLRNPEVIIIGIVILSSIFNFLNNSGKQIREAQRRAAAEEERRRRGFMADEQKREADPNTQSYEGYLRRTEQPDVTLSKPITSSSKPATPPINEKELRDLQADIFEALGMGGQKSAPTVNPQEELRRKLAEKMGRTAAPTTTQMRPPPATPRPAPRPTSKPVQSTIEPKIEVYLEQTRPEALSRDSMPDSFGHSKRQPHFDLPQNDPRFEGSVAFKGEGSSAIQRKPEGVAAVTEVRGKQIVPSQSMRPKTRFVDPKDAVAGLVWNEILERPRSMRRR
jgi:type II secretory pathway pseudopilin PulG